MTEDVHIPNSTSEYNRNVPSEKPKLQVIDIIDQIANSVKRFPCETTESEPPLLFTPENQEGVNHLIEDTIYETCDVEASEVSSGVKEDQGKPEGNKEKKNVNSSRETRQREEDAGEGSCEESHPVTIKGQEGSKQEERIAQPPQEENVCSTDKVEEEEEEEEMQLNEAKEQMKEETQLEAKENAAEEESEGREQKGNCKGSDSHQKGLEGNSKEFLPTSPRRKSLTEKPDEQLGTLRKSDISRHSYSRYNTISYRKIRKGNTKQRIDEFESMMHS